MTPQPRPARAGAPPRLVHVGNVVVDIVTRVPALPRRGGDVLADGDGLHAGGGFTVMAAAARQGLHVLHAGPHGTGPLGDLVRAALRAEGIDALQAPCPDQDTGYVVVLVEPDGERTFVTVPGAEATLDRVDLDRATPRPGDVVVVSGYGLAHPANRTALAGWLPTLAEPTTVVVDPGPLVRTLAVDALEVVLDRADWFTCNAREATVLTGRDNADAAATALLARTGRQAVLVRTGADGCWLAVRPVPSDAVPNRPRPGGAPARPGAGARAGRPGRPVAQHVPGFPVRAVDLNGAGDTHTGVLVAGLAAGVPPLQAVRRANAAAAIAVTRRGPATAPTPGEIDALLADR